MLARLLTKYECSVGSVVGIVSEDSFDFPSAILAALNIGAVFTSFSPFLAAGNYDLIDLILL